MMEVLQSDDGKKGRFFMRKEQTELAQMTYTWAGKDRIIIDHTEVSEALKGQNAGKQLVMKAVEFARSEGIKIIPLCPFARSVFQKNPAIRDVL